MCAESEALHSDTRDGPPTGGPHESDRRDCNRDLRDTFRYDMSLISILILVALVTDEAGPSEELLKTLGLLMTKVRCSCDDSVSLPTLCLPLIS